jgi:DNA polymerase-4
VGGSVPAHTALLCPGTARGLGGVRTSALVRMFQLWYNGRRVVSLCKANMDTMPQRFILHIDLDAFYAAIEQRDNPELRGKPVIVGGSPDRRGVVSTASYEARSFGVHSAMPSRTALWLCPEAIFLPPRFEVYRAVSQQVMAIFQARTALVEPLSLDEAYLDVTAAAHNFEKAAQLAREIKQQIRSTTELTASAGVSYCKFLAKLASDAQKPDGLMVISPEQAPAFLDALPIDKFFGVGKVTAAKLRELGIANGTDLKRLDEGRLRALLGKQGSQLYRFVRGEDDRPVEPMRERKSVGKEVTFERDLVDRDHMERFLEHLARQVEHRLVELDLRGRTLTLKVKWSDFQLITRSVSRSNGFQDAQAMMPMLRTLLTQLDGGDRPVRLLGVSVSNLLSRDEVQRTVQVTALPLWDME